MGIQKRESNLLWAALGTVKPAAAAAAPWRIRYSLLVSFELIASCP